MTKIVDQATYFQVERKANNLSFALKQGGEEQPWVVVQTEDVNLPQMLKIGVHAINTTTKVFSPHLEELKRKSK